MRRNAAAADRPTNFDHYARGPFRMRLYFVGDGGAQRLLLGSAAAKRKVAAPPRHALYGEPAHFQGDGAAGAIFPPRLPLGDHMIAVIHAQSAARALADGMEPCGLIR